LESQGYAHLQNFISPEERQQIESTVVIKARRVIAGGGERVDWYPDVWLDPEDLPIRIQARLQQLLSNVSKSTNLDVDLLWPGPLMLTVPTFTQAVNTQQFHSDGNPFFVGESAYNYLHMDMVLRKNVSKCANIDYIPFEALRKVDPELHQDTFGKGAQQLIIHSNVSAVKIDQFNYGRRLTSSADIDSISVRPQLSVGDIVLYRGDTLHRSQPPGVWDNVERLTLQIRARRAGDVVDVIRAVSAGGHGKFRSWFLPNRKMQPEAPMLATIASASGNPLLGTWGDVLTYGRILNRCSDPGSSSCTLSHNELSFHRRVTWFLCGWIRSTFWCRCLERWLVMNKMGIIGGCVNRWHSLFHGVVRWFTITA